MTCLDRYVVEQTYLVRGHSINSSSCTVSRSSCRRADVSSDSQPILRHSHLTCLDHYVVEQTYLVRCPEGDHEDWLSRLDHYVVEKTYLVESRSRRQRAPCRVSITISSSRCVFRRDVEFLLPLRDSVSITMSSSRRI